MGCRVVQMRKDSDSENDNNGPLLEMCVPSIKHTQWPGGNTGGIDPAQTQFPDRLLCAGRMCPVIWALAHHYSHWHNMIGIPRTGTVNCRCPDAGSEGMDQTANRGGKVLTEMITYGIAKICIGH